MIKLNRRRKLCECNCGELVNLDKRFVNHHNFKLKGKVSPNKGKGKPKSPPQLCACGICGLITKPGKKFIHGHNPVGKPKNPESIIKAVTKRRENNNSSWSEETRKKRAETIAKPENKERISKIQKEAQNRPEVRTKHSAANKGKPSAMKGKHHTSESIEKMAKTQKERANKPEARKKNSESKIKYYQDPENRAKRKAMCNTPEAIAKNKASKNPEKISKTVTEKWKEPELRARYVESAIKASNEPERKENHSKVMKNKWKEDTYVSKQMKSRNVKQNNLEKCGENLFCNLFPSEYKFVGYGEVIIDGKCPDFININGQKKIIELYGDYWHRDDNPQDRIDFFAKYGYDTLIVWEREFKDIKSLTKKLTDFHHQENPYSKHKE